MNDQESAVSSTLEDGDASLDLAVALRRSEERFHTLIERSSDAVAVICEGRFTAMNERLVGLLGCEGLAGLVDSPVGQWVHADDLECFAETTRALLDGPLELSLAPQELRLIATGGCQIHVEVAAIRIDYQGQPALHVTLRDLTERRRLRARMARSDRMASLGTLAAGVAHEINNPLSFILMNLEGVLDDLPGMAHSLKVLEAGLVERLGRQEAENLLTEAGMAAGEERVEDLAARIGDAHVGAQRVRDIVADLKTFARVETEEAALTAVRVEQALKVALNLASHEIKHKTRIRRDLHPTPLALAEEGRLSQVLVNLLVNAAQAPNGEAPKQVTLRSYARQDQVVLEIADNGAGIAVENLARVFEPFFSTKTSGEGSGLGLAISREIVRGFGGELEVESSPGRGATFRVCLPIAAESEVDLDVEDEPTEETLHPLRPRVLVVDDEPMLLRALERRLGRECEVTCAVTGAQALDRLSEGKKWDMVLCDMVMPGMDGVAVYRWIQTHQPQLLERTVLMTGGAVTREARRFLEETQNRVLPKPLQVPELLEVLRTLVHSGSSRGSRARG